MVCADEVLAFQESDGGWVRVNCCLIAAESSHRPAHGRRSGTYGVCQKDETGLMCRLSGQSASLPDAKQYEDEAGSGSQMWMAHNVNKINKKS